MLLTTAAEVYVAAQEQVAKGDHPVPKCLADAKARLAAVLEVNRTLCTTRSERQRSLQQSQEEIMRLQKCLDGWAIQEPARKARIEELQHSAGGAAGQQRSGRESQQLARETARLEEQITLLNDKNLQLSDQHREDRGRLVEQQSRLRTLGRRERQLSQHADFLAERLNELAAAAEATPVGQSSPSASDNTQPADLALTQLPADYRNLPGLCLSKLIGRQQQAPPATGKPSTPSQRQVQETAPGQAEPAAAPPSAGEDGPGEAQAETSKAAAPAAQSAEQASASATEEAPQAAAQEAAPEIGSALSAESSAIAGGS